MIHALLGAAFVIAMALYTVSIWSHHTKVRRDSVAQMSGPVLTMFGTALALDTFATTFLCATAATEWKWNLHTISGTAALAIMAIHFVFSLAGFIQGGILAMTVNRLSPWAWCVWMISFISGLPIW
jgi:fucose 4-O-acetylase-like acetyltransferase